MPNPFTNLQQKAGEFLTDYLRDTTTDQEILDFYGEGNIIGRKGILNTPGAIISEVTESHKLPGERPHIKREITQSDLMGLSGGEEQLINLEGSIDPNTKNPWQMKFETLPFPGGGIPTVAAQRFLKDFRVPIGNTVDYGFETSPNVIDLNTKEITALLNEPRSYVDSRAAFLAEDAGTPLSNSGPLRQSTQEDIERIRARAVPYTRMSGKMLTPSDWKNEKGFEIPSNLKNETLERFKSEIMQAEKPFGSVSQLTPVRESYENVRPGGDSDWRANLYEKTGLAGPMTEVSVRGAYGPSTGNVQMFTRGNERLLPIQPYTEFLNKYDASKPSALNTTPAADFTTLQKTIGTRNYLIGKNILQGRGPLGAGFNTASNIAGSVPLFDPEFRSATKRGDLGKTAQLIARDYVTGAATAPIIGVGAGVLSKVSPQAARIVTGGLGIARTANPIAVVSQLGGSSKITPRQEAYENQLRETKFKQAEAARQRGGKWKFPTPFGQVTIPELGISEAKGLFFR